MSKRSINQTKNDVMTTMNPFEKDRKYKKEGLKFEQKEIGNVKRNFLLTDKHINPELQVMKPQAPTQEEKISQDNAYSDILKRIKNFKAREPNQYQNSAQLLKSMFFQGQTKGLESILETNKSYTKKVKDDTQVSENKQRLIKRLEPDLSNQTMMRLSQLRSQMSRELGDKPIVSNEPNISDLVKISLAGGIPQTDAGKNSNTGSSQRGNALLSSFSGGLNMSGSAEPGKTTIVKEKKSGFNREAVREKWLKNDVNLSSYDM